MRTRILLALGAVLVMGTSIALVWACGGEPSKSENNENTFTVEISGIGTVDEETKETVRIHCYEGNQGTCAIASCSPAISLSLRAKPSTGFGYEFEGWSCDGSGCNLPAWRVADDRYLLTGVPCNDATPVHLTATFKLLRTLTVAVDGLGTVRGTVKSDTLVVCHAPTCEAKVLDGAPVDLEAIPDTDYDLHGWSGALSSDQKTVRVIMDADKQVTATFKPLHTLDVSIVGEGGGRVDEVSGTRIACPIDCSERILEGRTIRLSATAITGWDFQGWSGAETSQQAEIDVTMDAPKTLTATFVQLATLTVATTGTGAGTVTGAGISCPADCTEPFLPGTQVTLTANPAQGSTFQGWSGAPAGSTIAGNVLTFTMGPQGVTVTARFDSGSGFAGAYDLDLTDTPISCAPAPVVALQPTADVSFPGAMPRFTFRRLADGVDIVLDAATWDGATAAGRISSTTDPNCLAPGATCAGCVTPGGQTYPICYGLQLQVTFYASDSPNCPQGAAFGCFTGWLVVDQVRDPAAGVSLCLTRYDPFGGTRRAPVIGVR